MKDESVPKVLRDDGSECSRFAAVQAIREADLGYPAELAVRFCAIISAGIVSTLHTGDRVFIAILCIYLTLSFISSKLFLSATAPISRMTYVKLFVINGLTTGCYAAAAMYILTFRTIEMIALALCGLVGLGLYVTIRHRVLSVFTYWDVGLVIVTWVFFGANLVLFVDSFSAKVMVVMAAIGSAFYFLNAQYIALHEQPHLSGPC